MSAQDGIGDMPRLERMPVDWLLVTLLVLPLGVLIAKLPVLPTSVTFAGFFSLADLPAHYQRTADDVLFVILGAFLVVLFRLTFGVRVLGLFRPILLAMAFNIVGIPGGFAFLVFALIVIALIRPRLRTDHSYARLAVLLSLVAALLFAPLLAGKWSGAAWPGELALFPVIALCLTCESFAKTLERDGTGEAVRRAVATVGVALVIVAVKRLPGVTELFLRFPELLLVQAGCVLLINKHLALRLFEGRDAGSAPVAEDSGERPLVRPADGAVLR